MPGPYAHLTLVTLLTGDSKMDDFELPGEAKKALKKYYDFCCLGSISPDYPYLKIGGKGKKAAMNWANAMHHKYYTYTKENILHVGIDFLKDQTGNKLEKCFSWLLGYASHVAADVTCHPMTNLLVGDYEADNQKKHRESEMHQDAYIYNKKLGRNVRTAEHIQNVVGTCTEHDTDKVDQEIKEVWAHMLSRTFPDLYKRNKKIGFDNWHSCILTLIDDFAEELPYFPTMLLFGKGLVYPDIDDIEEKFISDLGTPVGPMSYEKVFDRALDNCGRIWKIISDAVYLQDQTYLKKINIWNLDNGQIIRTPKVMW